MLHGWDRTIDPLSSGASHWCALGDSNISGAVLTHMLLVTDRAAVTDRSACRYHWRTSQLSHSRVLLPTQQADTAHATAATKPCCTAATTVQLAQRIQDAQEMQLA
jgi:pyrroloquinoline quinone (PQQ) biosynthesis protein C